MSVFFLKERYLKYPSPNSHVSEVVNVQYVKLNGENSVKKEISLYFVCS